MSYPMRKYESDDKSWKDDLQTPSVRYEKKETNGIVKSCLVFSLRPKTAMGLKRVRINRELEG